MEGKPTFRFCIEPLGKHHDRAAFSSGDNALDNYFRTQASQDVKKRVAATFVLADEQDGKTVAGFYTLSATVIRLPELPEPIARKLPKYPNIPATLLGRLAVSRQHRGQGLGEILLVDALKRSLLQSRHIGSMAVVVDVKDDKACSFYEHYDFIRFPDRPHQLFLPMKTIEMLFIS